MAVGLVEKHPIMPLVLCPVCGKQFDPESSPAMPFCSNRCRLLDLRRWLDEQYGLPYEPEHEVQGPEARD